LLMVFAFAGDSTMTNDFCPVFAIANTPNKGPLRLCVPNQACQAGLALPERQIDNIAAVGVSRKKPFGPSGMSANPPWGVRESTRDPIFTCAR